MSPDGWLMEIRFALSERCLDLEGLVVEGLGLRSIGLSASAASMSSGVKGLRSLKSLMFREPSGWRYDVFCRGASCFVPTGEVCVSLKVISPCGQFLRMSCLV